LFNERGGTTVGDSVGNIGTANFPSDSNDQPVWLMNVNSLKWLFWC